jgi:hypothetical protein
VCHVAEVVAFREARDRARLCQIVSGCDRGDCTLRCTLGVRTEPRSRRAGSRWLRRGSRPRGPWRGAAAAHEARAIVGRDGTAHPHQGIGNELISGRPETGTGAVVVRERLGGLLRHYHRAA